MRRLSLSLVALACVPALSFACAATSRSGFGSGSSGDGSTSGSGVGGGSLDVSAVSGTGGGQSNCDATTEICDNELKNPTTCDTGLALGDPDPMKAAKALDLCRVAGQGPGWGLVSAKYVRANGAAAQAGLNSGLVPKFGKNIKPQLGGAMLALSSGHARDLSMTGACGSETCMTTGPGKPPAGFPQDVPGCTGAKTINDDIGLEVTLRAPKNAKGYEFNFAFMSFEFAEWVCTSFNDQFIALASPAPMGSINGNISFDKKKNPVSVNIALFDHCDPSTKSTFAQMCQFNGGKCPSPPSPYCPDGDGFMTGTGWGINDGWGDSGSTGWLVTTAPVNGGDQFTVRFAIWDTGDEALDSLVLVDGFRWKGDSVGVGTDTVPNPK